MRETRTAGAARLTAIVVALAALALPAGASAAPPSNDSRFSPQPLNLPTTLTGRTTEATLQEGEVESECASSKGSVWYAFTATADRRVVVNLDAAGDLDAVVDVYSSQRSQLRHEACDATDAKGLGGLSFRARKGQRYLVRVAQLSNSVAGTFKLDVFAPEPPARPPGPALPRRGVRGTLDRVQNTSDAWSVRMRPGRAYRINLAPAGGQCMRLSIYLPHTGSFEDGTPVRRLPCGGYTLYTPGPDAGGRYSLLVRAGGARGPQRYHLQVAPASRDDTAPGLVLGNRAHRRGGLSGGRIDVVDLYRFDVGRRSNMDLRLDTGADFDLVLLNDRGHRIECACGSSGGTITQQLSRGRYFVAVRARGRSGGRYRLTRTAKTITSTRISFNGARHATAPLGASVSVGVGVSPGVSGAVTILVDRFDPLAGWQFARRYRVHASGGRASVGFRPPSLGRYRARADFRGTGSASPSGTGYATLLVGGGLHG